MINKNYMTNKEIQKFSDEIIKHKYKCKCGHSVFIAYNKDKALCTWCKQYCFKSKKDEDLYRLKEKLK